MYVSNFHPLTEEDALHTKDLIIPLLAALWACTTLVFTVAKELNRLRDSIILGHDAGRIIPPEHLKHIMDNDWKPMLWCVMFVCFGFSLVSGASPFLLDTQEQTREAWAIAFGVSVFTGFMGCIWIPAARSDLRSMNDALRHHIEEHANAKGVPPQERRHESAYRLYLVPTYTTSVAVEGAIKTSMSRTKSIEEPVKQ